MNDSNDVHRGTLMWSRSPRLATGWRLAALLALCLSPWGTLRAQSQSQVEFHIGFGAGFPSGSLNEHASTGVGGIVGLGAPLPGSTLGWRMDAIVQSFHSSPFVNVCNPGSSCATAPSVVGADLAATIDFTGHNTGDSGRARTLYGLLGPGYFRTQTLEPGSTPFGASNVFSVSVHQSIGWVGGMGYRIPMRQGWWYIEARYYRVPRSGNPSFTSILIGLRS